MRRGNVMTNLARLIKTGTGSLTSTPITAMTRTGFGQRRSQTRTTPSSVPIEGDDSEGQLQSWLHWLSDFLEDYVMVEPYSPRHLTWEFLTLSLVAWEIIVIPWNAAFQPNVSAFGVFEWITRVIWTCDLLISSLTGYMDADGVVVMRPAPCVRYYMRNQMLLDIVVVATDWIEAIFTNFSLLKLLKGWKILRIIKVLRLKKAQRMFKRILEYFRSEKLVVVANIARIICMFVVISHIIACIWYAIGTSDNGWATKRGFTEQPGWEDQYTFSLHWAISIFFGEHVEMPTTPGEQLFVCIMLAFTFVIQIWFVSSITTAMTHLEIVSTRKAQMFSSLSRFMVNNGISREVQLKVTRNAIHAVQEKERSLPESDIEVLQLISQPLLMDLHFEIHFPVVCVHPFFRCYSEFNPDAVRKLCHGSVQWLMLSKDDIVFQAGTRPTAEEQKMYFITKGELSYTKQGVSELVTEEVNTKHWINEALLWVDKWMHCGVLRAVDDCKLLSLDVKSFQDQLRGYATDHGKEYAAAFVKQLNDTQEVSDIGHYSEELGSIMDEIFVVDWEWIRHDYIKKAARQDMAEGRTSIMGSMKSSVRRGSAARQSTGVKRVRSSRLAADSGIPSRQISPANLSTESGGKQMAHKSSVLSQLNSVPELDRRETEESSEDIQTLDGEDDGFQIGIVPTSASEGR